MKGKSMGEIKEITVSYGFTKNLGNFESIKVQMGATMTVSSKDDIDKEIDNLYVDLQDKVMEKIEGD